MFAAMLAALVWLQPEGGAASTDILARLGHADLAVRDKAVHARVARR